MSGDDLTLAKLRVMIDSFEAKTAAEDADAFVRLGVDGYKGYRILKHGGTMLVGGHERGGSRGAAIVAMLRERFPEVRTRLTDLASDGTIYLLDDSLYTGFSSRWQPRER